MKKKFLFGFVLSIIIIMTLPSVSAIEYKTMSDTIKSNIIEKIKNVDVKGLNKKDEDDSSSSEPQCVILFLLSILRNLRRLFRLIVLGTLLMPYFVYICWACILWIIF